MKAPANLARHQAGVTLAAAFGIALLPGGSQADVFTSAAGQATARQSSAAAPTRTITGGAVDGGGSVTSAMPGESTTEFVEDAPSGATTTTSADATPAPRRRRAAAPSGVAGASVGPKGGPKGGIIAPVDYAAPPALVFTAEAGYQSKYIWRGLDTVQMVSYNEVALQNGFTPTVGPPYQREDSGVYFLGANVAWNGLSFGAKYVRSVEDGFNPTNDVFPFSLLTEYEEYIFSLNYTAALVPDQWLDATLGFDFYYYPEDKFWGADHQGNAYLNFNMPRYQWAQPYINFFYNVETDSYGGGANGPLFDLVSEGWGFNLGVNGGGQIAEAGPVRFGISYGIDSIFKQNFEYEPDGFTHVSATLAFPVQFGENFTVTPSVTYVENLQGSVHYAGAGLDASYYDDPGWWWGIKATGTF
jgi:hypothetical protein